MTFIITLVALLVERFFDWSHLRRWQWYYHYQHAIMKRLPGSGALVVMAACVLPVMICAVILDYLLQNVLWGILAGLFQLLVLVYCLGPQNFWADSFAAINALVHGDPKLAAEKLKISFAVSDLGSAQSAHWQLLKNMFYAAEIRVFGVVFWFVILGPAGALMYRCVTASALLTQDVPDTEYMQHVRSMHDLLDWAPARLFTVMFALGGHFAKVIHGWKNSKTLFHASSSQALLAECGVAAMGLDEGAQIAEDGSVEKSAINMLDRAFVILLVLIAIVSLV